MKKIIVRIFLGLSVLYIAHCAYHSLQSPTIDYSGPIANWIDYGGTKQGDKYTPLTQINPENVEHLEVAWEYHTGDVSDGKGKTRTKTAFEATPILIDSILYTPTPFNRIIALHPETGKEIWVYDAKIDLTQFYANQLICRGVSYWKDPSNPNNCGARIFMATNDARLIAVNAETGIPCGSFGENGTVDLLFGVGEQLYKGEYQVTSPPAIIGNLVIVGSAVADNTRRDAPSGVVRAFNARTGELHWSWDLKPPKDSASNELISEAGYLLGSPNVWTPMAVDEKRDLLFVSTGNPSPDHFGGLRNNADYYGSSVVALQASTGKVVWHFQTVHHDIWDYDVSCQPTLTEIEKDGERIPAVIQATKMGLLFMLDRRTGKPIFPIEERPVPQTDVPGEYTSPTQPYPIKPLPLVRHTLSKEDLWGPLGISGDCEEKFKKVYYEGAYSPLKVNQPTLIYPGVGGGSNWGGIAVDKERQILVANTMDIPWLVTLIPEEAYEKEKKANPGVEISPQKGTPYAMRRELFLSNLGLPCNAPPWGTLAAIDLKTGDYLWQEPFGTVRDIAPVPVKIKYGVPNLGGPLVTASGLIIIAATMDDYIRAFDIHTGKQVWEERLPAGGQATPMTYRLNKTGKQYIVLAAGGHGRSGSKLGDSIIAYTLK